jgi:hypothetical protein
MLQDPTRDAVMDKARLDKFILVLNLPKCMRNIITTKIRTNVLVNQNALQFSLYGAPVPVTSVAHVDLPYSGQVAKISSMARPTWQALTVDFNVDSKFVNWWVLWKWMDIINNSKLGFWNPPDRVDPNQHPAGGLADYAANMTVYGRDEFNKNVIQFDYIGCFATELQGIQYNYQTPDEVKSQFTVQYTQFYSKLIEN